MFYTFKNTRISLNSIDVVVDSATLSHSASLESFYQESDRNSSIYRSNDGIQGSFGIRYYLTGEDFLKDYIDNESSILGNFGGLYFSQGYLQSYSIQGSANSPVMVQANGVFFDKIQGFYSPVYEDISKNIDFYNDSSTEISISIDGLGSVSEISSYSYSVNNEISPVFYENSTIPDRIYFGKRSVEASFSTSNLSKSFDINGKEGSASILFSNENGQLNAYSINGKMVSKEYSSSVGGKLSSDIRIISENYADSPIITSFDPDPSTLYAGETVTISGSSLLNTRRIVLEDREFQNFSIISDSEIIATVPYDAMGGNLSLFGYGGSYSTGFAMPDGSISISSVSPSTGIYGGTFTISGDNLYRISEVRLSASSYFTECSFEMINSSTMSVGVPDNFGGYGLSVDVYSSGLGRGSISGSLVDSFNILPEIVDFTPTGYANSFFVVVTNGHQGFDKIVFNDGPSYDTAGDIVYNELSGIVPEGDTFGRIKIYNTVDNVFVESVDNFYPTLSLYNISPTSGQEGTTISITGQNFNTGLMYNTSSSNYLVDFNGVTGEMEWVSNSGLVGNMVDMVTSGPIRIFTSDGITLYPSNVDFDFIPPNINITGIDSLTLSGDSSLYNKIKILGNNLLYIDSVYLIKEDSPNIGEEYSILTGNGTGIGVGLLGNTLSFYISGNNVMPTGQYSILASDLYSSDTISPYILF
jgi:hypothetical protein